MAITANRSHTNPRQYPDCSIIYPVLRMSEALVHLAEILVHPLAVLHEPPPASFLQLGAAAQNLCDVAFSPFVAILADERIPASSGRVVRELPAYSVARDKLVPAEAAAEHLAGLAAGPSLEVAIFVSSDERLAVCKAHFPSCAASRLPAS